MLLHAIAFLAVSLAAMLLSLALRDAVSDCRKYFDRAMSAEAEVRRLSAHAACAQAEIRALEDKLRELAK